MATREELKRQYKERTRLAGVYLITNTANGKVLLGSSGDLHGPLNRHRFMLSMGSHTNRQLQADWNRYGPESFRFEVLESVEVKDAPDFRLEDELSLLEEIWTEKLQPFGERGYNEDSRIRDSAGMGRR